MPRLSFANNILLFCFLEDSVRSELMEQLPHLAMYCNSVPALFADNITPYMLDIIVEYMTESNDIVRNVLSNIYL